MEQKKPWYFSKTIWGIVIAAAGFALRAWGVESPVLPESADFEQLKAYKEAIAAAQGSWEAITAVVLQAFGFLYGLYGRVVADQKIG